MRHSRISNTRSYYSTRVFLKISEAKNLPAMDLNGLCDPYCIVSVDDETVAR